MASVSHVRQPTKRPTTFDEHIPGSISGLLKDKTILTTAIAARENFTCAGIARLRVRWLATVSGTLKVRFLRSITNHDIEYPTNQPDDTTTVANVESVVDIPLHYGEGRGYIEFVPDGGGEVTYCDLLMT